MRSRAPLFALLFTAGLFAFPLVASAAIPFFGPIIDGKILDQTCPLGWGAVIVVINNLISFLLTIAIVFVAPIMIAYSGFLFVVNPVNAGGKEQAKKILTNTIVGIVIALAGWLIVDAIMAVLYDKDKFGKTWSELITSGTANICIPLAGSLRQAVPPVPGVTVAPPVTGDEATVRTMLTAAGISINKPPCPANTRYQDVSGGCTTVGGLNSNTINQIIGIKNRCGSVQVTGGNELGHADGGQSHTTGYKIDLATNIDGCITGGSGGYFSAAGARGGNARYLDSCGNEYVRESSHWDITVTRDCSR